MEEEKKLTSPEEFLEGLMQEKQDKSLNIYQKLAKIRSYVEVLEQTKKAYGYNYTPLADILANIVGIMAKQKVSLLPSIIYDSASVTPYSYVKSKRAKDGTIIEENVNEIIVSGYSSWTWVNDENPEERIELPWFFTGSQLDPSQAFGSGLTYSFRYFLINYFQISTVENDVEQWRSKQKEAEESEMKEVNEKIIQEIDKNIRLLLADNPDKSDDVKKLASKYVKGGNYFAIKDVDISSKMLQELNEIVKSAAEENKKNKKTAKSDSKETK